MNAHFTVVPATVWRMQLQPENDRRSSKWQFQLCAVKTEHSPVIMFSVPVSFSVIVSRSSASSPSLASSNTEQFSRFAGAQELKNKREARW